MGDNTYDNLLPKLGDAIDQSLASWETYLTDLATQPTYETIVTTEAINKHPNTTKVQALQYILSALPLRHTELRRASMDPDVEPVILPQKCDSLLEEIYACGENTDVDDKRCNLVLRRTFVANVVEIEKQLGAEEQCRKQDLGRLKAVHMALMSVRADGELGKPEVEKLLEAMEALGVSLAGSGLEEGLGEEEG